MDSVLMAHPNTISSSSNAFFAPQFSGAAPTATRDNGGCITAPIAGTLKNLSVSIATAMGGSDTISFTVQKNGTDTTLTTTLTGAATTGSDTTHTVSFVAGDRICIRMKASVANPTGDIKLTTICSAAANTSLVTFAAATAASFNATQWRAIQGSGAGTTASTTAWNAIMPTAGTFKSLYLFTSVVPGGTKTITATLEVNGVTTALTTTITGAAQTNQDTTHSVSVSAGDIVRLQFDSTGSPPATFVSGGIEFDPTIDGESLQLWCTQSTALTGSGATRYAPVDSTANPQVAEASVSNLSPVATWKKLYIHSDTDANSESRSFTLSVNTVASILTCTLTGTGVFVANDLTHTVSVSLNDLVATKSVASASLGSAHYSISYVTYIAPASSNTGFFAMF